MGGCTNCKGKSGCDHRKGSMMEEVEGALERLYPSRTWGEVADDAVMAMAPDELAALAEELAQELNAAAFVKLGDEDEPCDYIYVLALGRAPCIAQVRDQGVAPPAEWQVTEPIRELYLRVVLSHRARVAAVQQVAMAMTPGPDGYVISESPRAGVYDAPLLKRMQKLVAILPAYELLHVDFGEIAHAPQGFHAGSWPDAYGLGSAVPSIANYLFYPQPTTSVVTSFVEAA